MYRDILFLGPRFKIDYQVGGIVILFEDLLTYSDKNKINYYCIDTNLSNYPNRFLGLINILFKIFTNITKVKHVSLHGTASDYIFLAPFVILLSKLFHKKVSLRKFAGSFNDVYLNANFVKKGIIKFVLTKSDFNFFETKLLIDKFQNFNNKTYWWPNSRLKSDKKISSNFRKKFVFISQVKATKGVFEIIEASDHFDDSYTFDIYGPIMDENFIDKVNRYKNVNYKGLLSPDDVLNQLFDYNVLLIPTYHEGEGYPGIVLEAFSIGMPIISTYWKSIPEIVEHKKNGLLVPIKDVESLVNAIKKINQNNYKEFSSFIIDSFDKFDSEKVNFNFFNSIEYYNNAK
jgi:glycosyltransferase involved in cell wall biosynthesis